jgi:hypothetical protein
LEKPDCDRPLITNGSVTVDSGVLVIAIVWTPEPGSANRTASPP